MLQRSSESRPLFERGLELTAGITLRARDSVAPAERVLLLSWKRTHALALRTCVAWSHCFAQKRSSRTGTASYAAATACVLRPWYVGEEAGPERHSLGNAACDAMLCHVSWCQRTPTSACVRGVNHMFTASARRTSVVRSAPEVLSKYSSASITHMDTSRV